MIRKFKHFFKMFQYQLKMNKLAEEYADKISGVICESDRLDEDFSIILVSNLYNDYKLKANKVEQQTIKEIMQ